MPQQDVERAVRKYLDLWERLRSAAVREGVPIEEYKPTETDCLRFVFSWLNQSSDRGLAFLSLVALELVWAQCLGNGNHRTAALLLQSVIEREVPQLRTEAAFARRFAAAFDRFADRSKTAFRHRGELGYSIAQLKNRHASVASDFVKECWGNQSRHLETIGAQRLMDFFASDDH